MNREILFRGKSVSTNEWVYGYLYIHNGYLGTSAFIRGDKILDTEVDIKTIGQYTGLEDSKGKRIFENDIIEEGCNGFISSVVWDNKIGTYKLKDLGNYYIKDAPIEWEVIGNIFDEKESE